MVFLTCVIKPDASRVPNFPCGTIGIILDMLGGGGVEARRRPSCTDDSIRQPQGGKGGSRKSFRPPKNVKKSITNIYFL